MILIPAATGKTGRLLIEALRRRDEPVRAMARSENVHELRTDGVETFAGDILDPAALREALDGVRGAVFIAPTFTPMEVAMGRSVIDAALAAGVERFLQFSVAHPQIDFLANHRAKLEVEDYLVNSGLDFTILQPMHMMQNYDPLKAASDGVLRMPYTVSLRRSFVDLADVAEAAAIALTEPGHTYATYPLCGPDLLSVEEVAAIIAARAGVEVGCEQLPISALIEAISEGHRLYPYTSDGIHRLFTYYSLHGLVGNPNVLRWLLGREPTTVEQYVDRCFSSESGPPPPAWFQNVRIPGS
jgi:uncharacterized protein YbjT (DUF2867 family)